METASYAQALELYKKNLLEFKFSGNSAYKTAYENAERWIQLYLKNLEDKVKEDKQYVDKFVQDYSQTNPELNRIRSQLQEVKEKGPKLQSQYETIKMVGEEPPPDNTMFYVKLAAIAGLLGIGAAIGFF
jgi:septal ring factor EnvC (AmiA/AmiB activator)